MAEKKIQADLNVDGKITTKQINLDDSLSTNQAYVGTTITITAGENLVFGDVVYLKFSDGKFWKAKADAIATTPVVAMALGSITANNSGVVLIDGVVRYDSWSFASANIWLSAATAGAITSTQPSTTGNQIQNIGVALTSNLLKFKPSIDIGEI